MERFEVGGNEIAPGERKLVVLPVSRLCIGDITNLDKGLRARLPELKV